MTQSKKLLTIEHLKVYYPVKESPFQSLFKKKEHRFVKAVDDISFDVQKGETLSLVGESGCGKTTIGRAIVGLNEPTAGSISFEGKEISNYSFDEMRPVRSQIQFIFQDPYSSLNPRMTVYQALRRSMTINHICPSEQMLDRAKELMHMVNLSEEQLVRYPHEFSGGQRQRICIARCLAVNPDLIIADEPTASLDVSIQSQILNLLLKLKSDLSLTMIFISHDLSVVNYISNRTAVMYLGHIVELGQSRVIFKNPMHPYTKALLEAVPRKQHGSFDRKVKLIGSISSPINPPPGCTLHPRCPFAFERCKTEKPVLKEVGDRMVACHLFEKNSDEAKDERGT